MEDTPSQAPNQSTISPSCSDWFRDGNRSKPANESIPEFFVGTKRKMFFPLQLLIYQDINRKLPVAISTFWRKSAQERGHTGKQSEIKFLLMMVSEPESKPSLYKDFSLGESVNFLF